MSRRLLRLGRFELIRTDESALQQSSKQLAKPGLPSIYEAATGWYAPWYFGLRLEEEIARSRRHSLDLAFMALSFDDLAGAISHERLSLNTELRRLLQSGLRQTDIPGSLDMNHFTVGLPQTGPEEADLVRARVDDALASYQPTIKLVSLDEDATGTSLVDRIFTNSS